ncbi:helix-turn-helix domain-containing protein [Chromobacterium phragmitis]|uniref:Helix-turn-helix domain-containing protein n=1 Tax=Chromobacterium phragmitis TaxID=2202141 RepID=A0ABV0J0T2_9NEIS
MIGFRIKEARTKRKRSQQWLAAEVGVTQASACSWEQGKTDPTTENLSRIALALRISYDWLATGRGNPELSYVPVQLEATEPQLSSDQKELLELYQSLTKSRRETLLLFLKAFATK